MDLAWCCPPYVLRRVERRYRIRRHISTFICFRGYILNVIIQRQVLQNFLLYICIKVLISTSALVTALLHCVRGCTRDVYMSVFEEEIKIDFPSLSPRCALIACSSSRLRMYTRPPLNSRNKLYPVYLSSIQFTQQMLGTKSSSTVLDTSILPLPDTSIIMSFVEIAWHPRAN